MLKAILDRKEERAAQRQSFLRESSDGAAVINFVLNIPGAEKNGEEAECFFGIGWSRLEKLLTQQYPHMPYQIEQIKGACGPELIIKIDRCDDPLKLKHSLVALEEADEIARIFDLDLYSWEYPRAIGREVLGLPARRCFLCSSPASECARSAAHGKEELRAHITGLYKRYSRS